MPRSYWGPVLLVEHLGGAYWQKVKATSPIAYWPLWDGAGAATAEDISGNGFHGTPTAVTFGATGIGDGRTAATFDGATSFINCYSAGLNAVFSGAEGSLLTWFQVTAAGVWTDGVLRRACAFAVSDTHRLSVARGSANSMSCNYRANNVQETVGQTVGDTIWHALLMTWSKSGEIVNGYYDGTKLTPSTTLGVWAGNLSASRTLIGAHNNVPSIVWAGNLAHTALWNYALSDALGVLLTRP